MPKICGWKEILWEKRIFRHCRRIFNFTIVEALSWPAIIKFFIFKVENIVFADVFVFLRTTKTTVLPYNRLCFQVQVLGALNQF